MEKQRRRIVKSDKYVNVNNNCLQMNEYNGCKSDKQDMWHDVNDIRHMAYVMHVITHLNPHDMLILLIIHR